MTASIVLAGQCVVGMAGLLALVWMGLINGWRRTVRWSLVAAIFLALLAVSAVRDAVGAQTSSPLAANQTENIQKL